MLVAEVSLSLQLLERVHAPHTQKLLSLIPMTVNIDEMDIASITMYKWEMEW